MTESPIHFEGVIPNASQTPRGEVGGMAVFDGVLMRSRTGFAIALRRPDGRIELRQVPFASIVGTIKPLRLPLLRGAASLGEMMVIGTRALSLSTQEEPSQAADPARTSKLLALSLASLLTLFLLLPTVVVSSVGTLLGLDWHETDSPLLVGALETVVRLVTLVIYLLIIGQQDDVRRLFSYHGAEHQAALALEEGGDVTVARAQRHDTVHPRCGTTFIAFTLLASFLIFAACDAALGAWVSGFPAWPWIARQGIELLLHLLLLPLVVGLSFELVKWGARNRKRKRVARLLLEPGYWLQRLTTRRPSAEQTEVAIVALFGALAIDPQATEPKTYLVRGLEDDESAPGYVPRSPARPAPPEGLTGAAAGNDSC